ncbi:STAS domain-containing protein [Maridesulfovibrio bastinii]|uniref:STAS domain-containing protein n=1 Tax=Maridesulfovibrio bastinii TaxID=47157 RepID=UPI0004015F51|nr:STAS domain-containing protein [Maridesulfovibrio bastinii]
MGLEVIENKDIDIIVFELKGRLDSNTSGEFEEKLLGSIQGGESKIILDFENLEYISSAGLRVLLKAARELKGGDGQMLLCSLKDYIKEVFDLSGFVSFLPIHNTKDECLKAF